MGDWLLASLQQTHEPEKVTFKLYIAQETLWPAPSGKVVLKAREELLKANIAMRFSLFSYKELEELSLSLVKLRHISSRLE